MVQHSCTNLEAGGEVFEGEQVVMSTRQWRGPEHCLYGRQDLTWCFHNLVVQVNLQARLVIVCHIGLCQHKVLCVTYINNNILDHTDNSAITSPSNDPNCTYMVCLYQLGYHRIARFVGLLRRLVLNIQFILQWQYTTPEY